MSKVTLQSIAEKMNVSTVAVYKALNNQKGVSESLRKKIKAYAKSVGYVSKTSSQEINNKRFLFYIKRDFFLTPSEQFYSAIFYFLSNELSKVNSTLQVAFIEDDKSIDTIKTTIANFKPDGVFFACELSKDILRLMEKSLTPIVYIDLYSPLYEGNYIFVDNYQASYMLTHYLIEKNHQKIGFIGDIKKTSSISDRYFGYIKAMNEANLAIASNWHINENIENSAEVTKLPIENMPTAFITHCDSAAQKLYSTLSLNGLRIPDDVSIVSFDNTSLSETLLPRLTSSGPLKDNMARKALSAMVDALKGKHSLVQIRTQLFERESVKELI